MAPETKLRNTILAILHDEFDAEGVSVRSDRLLSATGEDGAYAAVYPDSNTEWSEDANVGSIFVTLQFHLRFDAGWASRPDLAVDPEAIETIAERIRQRVAAIHGATDSPDASGWFFRILRTDYPPDPTGNITRLEMTIGGFSQNTALYETV